MPILRDKWMCRFTYVQNAAKNGVSASQNTLKNAVLDIAHVRFLIIFARLNK